MILKRRDQSQFHQESVKVSMGKLKVYKEVKVYCVDDSQAVAMTLGIQARMGYHESQGRDKMHEGQAM